MTFRRRARSLAPLEVDPNNPATAADAVNACLTHAITNGVFMQKSDPSRIDYVRVSSFPFCPSQWFLNQLRGRSQHRKLTTPGAYFTKVGTTVHEVFQHATSFAAIPTIDATTQRLDPFPANGLLIQDWVCKECAHRVEFSPHPPLRYPKGKRCPNKRCTSNHPEYEPPRLPFYSQWENDEHEVTFSEKVLGHMDGTFAFPPDPTDPESCNPANYSPSWLHIPIDYKTCSGTAIDTAGRLPYASNADQLLSYGAIKQHDGYNVPGCVLVYIQRDNPFKRKACYLPLNQRAQVKRILSYERAHTEAALVDTLDAALALPMRVTRDFEHECEYCPYQPMCQDRVKGDDSGYRVAAKDVLRALHDYRERSKAKPSPT